MGKYLRNQMKFKRKYPHTHIHIFTLSLDANSTGGSSNKLISSCNTYWMDCACWCALSWIDGRTMCLAKCKRTSEPVDDSIESVWAANHIFHKSRLIIWISFCVYEKFQMDTYTHGQHLVGCASEQTSCITGWIVMFVYWLTSQHWILDMMIKCRTVHTLKQQIRYRKTHNLSLFHNHNRNAVCWIEYFTHIYFIYNNCDVRLGLLCVRELRLIASFVRLNI